MRTPPLSRMGAEERESMGVPGSEDGCDPDWHPRGCTVFPGPDRF